MPRRSEVFALRPWAETEDPVAIVADLVGAARRVADLRPGLGDFVLALQDRLPGAGWRAGVHGDRAAAGGEGRRRGRGRWPPPRRPPIGWPPSCGRGHRAGRARPSAEVSAGHSAGACSTRATRRSTSPSSGSGPTGPAPTTSRAAGVIGAGRRGGVRLRGRYTLESGYCSDITRTVWHRASRAPRCRTATPCCGRPSRRRGRCAGRRGGEAVDAVARAVIEEAGYGAALHPPHRSRHRDRGARGPLHGGRERPAAGGRPRLLRGPGHLLRRPVRGPHRGHRGGRPNRAADPQPGQPTDSLVVGGPEARWISASAARWRSVTASSRGLGRASAEALAAEGVRVVISARGRPRPSPGRGRRSRAAGAEVLGVVADVTDPDVPARLVAATRRPFRSDRHRGGQRRRTAAGPGPRRRLTTPDRGRRGGQSAHRACGWSAQRCPTCGRGMGPDLLHLVVLGRAAHADPGPVQTARAGLWAWAKTAAADLSPCRRITLNLACPGPHATDRMRQLGGGAGRPWAIRPISAASWRFCARSRRHSCPAPPSWSMAPPVWDCCDGRVVGRPGRGPRISRRKPGRAGSGSSRICSPRRSPTWRRR